MRNIKHVAIASKSHGLGHVTRDLEIANILCELEKNLKVSFLCSLGLSQYVEEIAREHEISKRITIVEALHPFTYSFNPQKRSVWMDFVEQDIQESLTVLKWCNRHGVGYLVSDKLFGIPILNRGIISKTCLVTNFVRLASGLWEEDTVVESFVRAAISSANVVLLIGSIESDIMDELETMGNIFHASLVILRSRGKEVTDTLIYSQNKEFRILVTVGGTHHGAPLIIAVADILESISRVVDRPLFATFVLGPGISKIVLQKSLKSFRSTVIPYTSCMANLIREADLVIAQAGFQTLSECAYYGVRTVVVPLPGHPFQHRTALWFNKQNNMFMCKMGTSFNRDLRRIIRILLSRSTPNICSVEKDQREVTVGIQTVSKALSDMLCDSQK